MNRSKNFHSADFFTLSHPLVFLSIVILLFNDHVLKIYAPSWLSGKLSDFAGLFFFPILLSVVINTGLRLFNRPTENAAKVSFCFTAIFFTLIKTTPAFSDLTETFLSGLLSTPVQVITDPSDLTALVMLIPAWKLRSQAEYPSPPQKRRSYFALALGSLAALATSPAYNPAIMNLAVDGNFIYAKHNYSEELFYSADGGITWRQADFEIPESVLQETGSELILPVTLCLPDEPSICYQTGTETILESSDGGKTWAESWSIPAGRREFLERNSPFPDIGPYDLVMLDYNGQRIIVAALGTGGVLVRTGDGPWENRAVDEIGPLALRSASLGNAIGNVTSELILTSAYNLLILIFLVIANVVDRGSKLYSLLKKASLAFLISFFLFYWSMYLGNVGVVMAFILLFILAATIILFVLQIIINTTSKGQGSIFITLTNWFVSCVAFLLWADGTIPVYGTVLVAVLILNTLTTVWIIQRQIANTSPPPTDP